MDNLAQAAYADTDNNTPPRRFHWLGPLKRGPDAAMLGRTLYLPHYTYKDYKKWPEDFRCELIDGQVYMMSSPTSTHQGLLGEIYILFGTFLDDKPCRAYVAPYDVRLFAGTEQSREAAGEDDDTVLVPDMVVICDEKKRFKEGCHGAPDLVLEILSPSTRERDLKLKKERYLEAGVREYWILDPDAKTLLVCLLKEEGGQKRYEENSYTEADTVKVNIFNGSLAIKLRDVFQKAERY
jgi:Uma2 family endonuclease